MLAALEGGPDQKTERFEELNALEKAISELPEELKNAFILTALEDRPQAETAELLGISIKAVEMKVYRARRLLLEKMNREDGLLSPPHDPDFPPRKPLC